MTLLYPSYLYLLLLLPLVAGWYLYRRHSGHASLRIPAIRLVAKSKGVRPYLRHILLGLRLGALALLIIALARPQSTGNWEELDTEGIDIMLTMDLSSSMLAMDFSPNRIEAAKRVASSFVAAREHDNIGLVAFAGESFTASPLTSDHASLLNRISDMTTGIIEDRTAIGLGIATAVNRLRESKTASKVIVLLTDGTNNSGDISPEMAAEIAKSYGITIYTIGMGSLTGEAAYPVQSFFGDTRIRNLPVEIDEETMRQVAEKTGGLYFRASDDKSLDAIYSEIDKLEKTKLHARSYHITSELYPLFALWGLLLLLGEFVLRHTLFRTNP